MSEAVLMRLIDLLKEDKELRKVILNLIVSQTESNLIVAKARAKWYGRRK